MVIRGAEGSLDTGVEVNSFHFGRVENRIRVGPNETKMVATEGLEFGLRPGEKHWGFRLLRRVVVKPRAGVVVHGEKSITFVSNGPGEHARVVHVDTLSGLVVIPSEMGMSVFVRVGLDLGGQTVRALAVSRGNSGEVNFIRGSDAKRSKVEMAQFGMPPFPRVLSDLEFAAGSGIRHPPHWWFDNQPVCWSSFTQVLEIGPSS